MTTRKLVAICFGFFIAGATLSAYTNDLLTKLPVIKCYTTNTNTINVNVLDKQVKYPYHKGSFEHEVKRTE